MKFLALILVCFIIFSSNAFAVESELDDLTYTEKKLPTIFNPEFKVEIFASGLKWPTTMTFLNDDILVLEKNAGTVRHIVSNGTLISEPVLQVEILESSLEGGLLGIASKNSTVFLYYTESRTNDQENIQNTIFKYQWDGNSLKDPIFIKSIPTFKSVHNGGIMTVSNDGTVYVVIGDQNAVGGEPTILNPLLIKPVENMGVVIPIESPGKPVVIGLRNSFGLTIDPETNNIWYTENGPSRYDEINMVENRLDGGWPIISGPIEREYYPPIPDTLWKIKAQIQLIIMGIYNSIILGESYVYEDPIFSWEKTIAPTAIQFPSYGFDKNRNSVFVGDCNLGNIYNFELNEDRNGFVFKNYSLSDSVLNVDESNDEILFGEGFGCITDIKFHDDSMYIVSLTEGKIFKISSDVK